MTNEELYGKMPSAMHQLRERRLEILTVGTFKGGEAVSLCQISPKSVKPRPKYGDFSIFQDGGRRHLGFSQF